MDTARVSRYRGGHRNEPHIFTKRAADANNSRKNHRNNKGPFLPLELHASKRCSPSRLCVQSEPISIPFFSDRRLLSRHLAFTTGDAVAFASGTSSRPFRFPLVKPPTDIVIFASLAALVERPAQRKPGPPVVPPRRPCSSLFLRLSSTANRP